MGVSSSIRISLWPLIRATWNAEALLKKLADRFGPKVMKMKIADLSSPFKSVQGQSEVVGRGRKR
jgi:hypothetical protein